MRDRVSIENSRKQNSRRLRRCLSSSSHLFYVIFSMCAFVFILLSITRAHNRGPTKRTKKKEKIKRIIDAMRKCWNNKIKTSKIATTNGKRWHERAGMNLIWILNQRLHTIFLFIRCATSTYGRGTSSRIVSLSFSTDECKMRQSIKFSMQKRWKYQYLPNRKRQTAQKKNLI